MTVVQGLLRSWRKSKLLARIARAEERACRNPSIDNLFSGGELNDRLLLLVASDPMLARVMKKHSASSATLNEIQSLLLMHGCSEVIRGHYLPASAIAFGQTLDYCLQNIVLLRSTEEGAVVADRIRQFFAGVQWRKIA